MKSALALSTLLAVTAISHTSHAGAFLGLGIGTGTDLGEARVAEDGRSLRAEGGYAIPVGIGRLAIEGMYQGFDVNTTYNGQMGARSLAVAGRYNFPLGNGFEAFARMGVQQLALTQGVRQMYDASGKGPIVGAGFELHPGIGMDLAFWVDLTYAKATITGQTYSMDTDAHFFTAGVSVGF